MFAFRQALALMVSDSPTSFSFSLETTFLRFAIHAFDVEQSSSSALHDCGTTSMARAGRRKSVSNLEARMVNHVAHEQGLSLVADVARGSRGAVGDRTNHSDI